MHTGNDLSVDRYSECFHSNNDFKCNKEHVSLFAIASSRKCLSHIKFTLMQVYSQRLSYAVSQHGY